MHVKILSLILCVLIIGSTVLFSCAEKTGSENESENTSETTVTEELSDSEKRKAISDDIPELNFEGQTYRMLTRDDKIHISDIYVEKMSGDVIEDAVFMRNQTVEERFNAKLSYIAVSEADEATLTNKLRVSVQSNSDEYDIALGHMILMGTSVTNNLFYNWYELNYINFEKPWWIQSAQEQLEIDGKTFLALGDFSNTALDFTYCFYFNKNLFNDYNLEYPYEKVRSNEWTVEYMKSLIKDIYVDLNNDNKRDEEDLYGLVTNCYSGNVTWTYAFGEMITKKNDEGLPELVLNNNKTVSIVETLYNLLIETEGVYVSPNTTTPKGTSWAAVSSNSFKNNKALVVSGLFNDAITHFREVESDYGFLPYPKWDTEQSNYYTMLDGHGPLFGIPITIGNNEFVGAITEAMSAEGYKQVTPAYYDVALKTKFTRDEESAEMIDLVLAGRVFDFGYLYDGWNGLAFYLQNLLGFGKPNKNFSSFYAKSEKAANRYYNKIIEAYEKYE